MSDVDLANLESLIYKCSICGEKVDEVFKCERCHCEFCINCVDEDCPYNVELCKNCGEKFYHRWVEFMNGE